MSIEINNQQLIIQFRPTLESDPNCNEKKKYIGNDFATIVYNESGEDYNLNTIKVIDI